MKHAYKLFAAAIVLIAMVFGSMEVAYRAAEDRPPESGPAKAVERPADAPKPVIIPAPNAAPAPESPNPGVQPAVELPKDQAPPPPDAPPGPGEAEATAPMIILPADEG